MNQQQLPTVRQQNPEYSMPPETDSSGDAVAFVAGVTETSHETILPELAVGSPQKPVEVSSSLPKPSDDRGNQAELTATQTSTPQTHLPPPPLPSPSSQANSDKTGVENTGFWKTVVVNPTPAPTPAPSAVLAPPVGYSDRQKAVETPTVLIDTSPATAVPSTQEPKAVVKNMARLPTMGGGEIVEEEEARPVIVKMVSIGFGLLALYSGSLAVGTAGLAYLLNTATVNYLSSAIVGEFSQAYPRYALFPISAGVLATMATYQFFISQQGSRKAWLVGIVTLLLGVVWVMAIGSVTLAPLELILGNPQFVNQEPLLKSITWEMIQIATYGLYGCLGLIGLLLVGFRGFRFASKPLHNWQKWAVAGMALITIGGVGGYFGQMTIVNADTDLGHAAVAETAGFHVYKPKELPAGWTQTSLTTSNTTPGSVILGRDDFVETYFDRSLAVRAQGQPSAQVILRQIDVPPGFDLASFARTLVETPVEVGEVTVQRADGQRGYAIEKLTDSYAIRALVFTTSDNVLILFSSRGAQVEDMIALANRLD